MSKKNKGNSATLTPPKNFNDTKDNAKKYADSGLENTYYLGYRDIPYFLEKYTVGKRAIDYGCGTGRSTRFLKKFGFETIGVDVSKEMLAQALTIDDESHYLHIKSGQIPVLDNSYDLVFSCFVFFTISTKKEILAILKEIHRCLRDEGIFILVTGTEELYSNDWVSYNVNYHENRNPKSGQLTRIQLKDRGIDFVNYFWTDSDYEELFKLAGLKLVEKHFPLGHPEEKTAWVSETEVAPYAVYVLQK